MELAEIYLYQKKKIIKRERGGGDSEQQLKEHCRLYRSSRGGRNVISLAFLNSCLITIFCETDLRPVLPGYHLRTFLVYSCKYFRGKDFYYNTLFLNERVV